MTTPLSIKPNHLHRDVHEEATPMVEFSVQLDAAAYLDTHAEMGWNASLWEGMLESLPGF